MSPVLKPSFDARTGKRWQREREREREFTSQGYLSPDIYLDRRLCLECVLRGLRGDRNRILRRFCFWSLSFPVSFTMSRLSLQSVSLQTKRRWRSSPRLEIYSYSLIAIHSTLFPFSLRRVLFDENIANFVKHEDDLLSKNQMKDANEEHCQTNTGENDHWLQRGEYFVIPSCSLIAVNFGLKSCQEYIEYMRISCLPGCYHLIKKNKERGRCVVFNQATLLFSLSKLVMHDKGFVLIVARNSETRLFIDLYLLSSLLSLVSSVTCYLPVTLGWRISSLFQIPYLLFSSSQSSLLFDVTQTKTQFRNSLSLSF